MKKLLVALAIALLWGGLGQVTEAATFKVGVAVPLTGDLAQVGLDMKNGAVLAADEWNAANPDWRMEIVAGDDQADPKQAVAVANKFINEGIIGVVGHATSACTIPTGPVYQDSKIVQVNPTATNPQVTDRGLWNVFRVCGRDDQQGKVAADFVAKKGIKRVAVIHDKGAYGQGLANAFRDALKRDHGIEAVYYGTVTRGDKDFSAVLTLTKAAGPEVIYYGGYHSEGGLLAKQAKALGISARFMGADWMTQPDFLEVAGKEAAEGGWATFSPDLKNIPSAKQAMEAYEKRFGPVGPFSIYSYVAAKVLFEGIKGAGAKSAKDGRKIADYIRKKAHETAVGRLQFDKKGDVLEAPYVIYEVRNGEFVQITGLKQQAQR